LKIMAPTSCFLSVAGEQLHYYSWGSGKKLLLAFHGYGNSAGIFEPFVEPLCHEFTILSFDLPHHGLSRWQGAAPLPVAAFVEGIQALMAEHGVQQASLMGYSMGGRVCMSLLVQAPALADKLLLLAPDGLTAGGMYRFLTRTVAGRWVFRSLIERPAGYIGVLKLLRRWKLIKPSLYEFAMFYIEDRNMRLTLAKRWPSVSAFLPRRAQVRATIRKYNTPVFIFMGRHDKIIPPQLAFRFQKGLKTVHVQVLERGHRIFDLSNAALIAQSLL